MTFGLVFTGQGSPAPAAGTPWRTTPQWDLVEEMGEQCGADLSHLLCDAAEVELVDTANAQLATFALGVLLGDALTSRWDLPASAWTTAGHSLGEYTALTVASTLSPTDGAALVAERGAAMRDACVVRPGTMAAIIGLDAHVVADACEAVDGGVWVANDNAPGQVVIAGAPDAVEAAGEALRELGARRPMPLKVAGAFHTPLMASAQTRIDAALEAAAFSAAPTTTWANVDASEHSFALDWPSLLSHQLCSRVRWREEIAVMAASGVDTFVELGPGTVLSGMIKRIVPDARRLHAATPDEIDGVLAQLAR